MPTAANGTVIKFLGLKRPPARKRNAERRPREYLTPAEVEMLIATARKRGRYGHRDATMILIAYRHGLRIGELVALRWDQVDFGEGFLHVTRLKHGVPSVHPLGGKELRAQRRLRREQSEGRHLFQDRARCTDDAGRLPQDAGADRRGEHAGLPDSPAYAAARLRVQTRE
jgi:integrase